MRTLLNITIAGVLAVSLLFSACAGSSINSESGQATVPEDATEEATPATDKPELPDERPQTLEESTAGSTGQTNFRLLISDEVNAIDDFKSLHVTISSIGIHEGGEEGTWHNFDLDAEEDYDGDGVPGLDLTELTDENALEIWSGDLTEGEYTKLFIYVNSVMGTLHDDTSPDIKLPSDKLQVSKPFTISDSVVEFVYDITVIRAGQSGMYVLKPQIAETGPNQPFNDVTPQKQKGKPEEEEELTLELADCDTDEVIEDDIISGDEVKVLVTHDGEPVEGAAVEVEGMDAMTTDENGLTPCFTIPDEDELEIAAEIGDLEGELEIDLEE